MMGAPLSMARLLLIDQDPEYAERLRFALVGPPAIPLSREPGLDEARARLDRIKREPSPTSDRFERLIERARDIIATVDEAGTITYISPAIEHTLGVGPPGFSGKVIWELVHPDDVAALYRMLTALFADGQTRSIEFQMRHVGGAWRRL